jgi:hypothetical protein
MSEQLGVWVVGGVAVLGVIVLLILLRQRTGIGLLLAAALFAGLGAARLFGWSVPFVLPSGGGAAEAPGVGPLGIAAAAGALLLVAALLSLPRWRGALGLLLAGLLIIGVGAAIELWPARTLQGAVASAPSAPPPVEAESAVIAELNASVLRDESTRSLGPPPAAAPRDDVATASAPPAPDGSRKVQMRNNAPDHLQRDVPTGVSLVVDASGASEDELDEEFRLRELKGSIRSTETTVPSSELSAMLTGDGFDIKSESPARILLGDHPITFRWQVTPRLIGRQTLVLEVFAHVGDAEASVRVIRQPITIEVTPWTHVAAFMQATEPLLAFAEAALSLIFAFVKFGLDLRGARPA